MDWLQLSNIIILFGSIAVAILNVAVLFEKTGGFFKKKSDKVLTEKLEKVLDEKIPQYLEENEKKLKKDICKEINDEFDKKIESLKIENEKQNKNNELLTHHIQDILRQKIENIYYEYRADKEIPRFALENLQENYKDYKDAGGNHHIDKLYKRMLTWKITDELPEYDKE